MKKRLLFLVSFLFFLTVTLTGEDYVLKGLNAYSRSDWDTAITSFEQAVNLQPFKKKIALYWLIMAHASARNYHIAVNYADLFLKRYPHDKGTAEVMYQKGRISHLCREYKRSTAVLQLFIKKYSRHPKIPSAHYWIAENEFVQRQYLAAREGFNYVVATYPTSGKLHLAQYRMFLIDRIIAGEAVDMPSIEPPVEEYLPAAFPTADKEKPTVEPPQEKTQGLDRIAQLEQRIRILEEKIVQLSDELNRQHGMVESQKKANEQINADREKLKNEMLAEKEKLKKELAAEQEKMRKQQEEAAEKERLRKQKEEAERKEKLRKQQEEAAEKERLRKQKEEAERKEKLRKQKEEDAEKERLRKEKELHEREERETMLKELRNRKKILEELYQEE